MVPPPARPARERLCVALDGSDRGWLLEAARELGPHVGWLKLGLEAFSAHGPELVRALADGPARLFLDLKLHDIPTTVRRAVEAIARTGAALTTVHASGGEAMLRAAAAGAGDADGRLRIVAVTVLTSLGGDDLERLGLPRQIAPAVVRWTRLALDCGLDGVVASAREAGRIREQCGTAPLLVTPGIRPTWAADDDQRRVTTPTRAVADGSDLLVVGRPITTAADPAAAAREIVGEIDAAAR